MVSISAFIAFTICEAQLLGIDLKQDIRGWELEKHPSENASLLLQQNSLFAKSDIAVVKNAIFHEI